jgi:uncharacterized protein
MLQRRGDAPSEGQPSTPTSLTVEVPDFDDYVKGAVSTGGSVALPAEDMPGIGRLAYIKDPDGNLLGLLQPEASTN